MKLISRILRNLRRRTEIFAESDTADVGAVLRAFALFGIEGIALTVAIWSLAQGAGLAKLAVENSVPARELLFPVLVAIVSGIVPVLVAILLIAFGRVTAIRIVKAAEIAGPIIAGPLLVIVFDWKIWEGRPLHFLVAAAVTTFLLEYTVKRALLLGGDRIVNQLFAYAERMKQSVPLLRRLPLVIAVLGATGYAVYFSYYTVMYHWNGLTSTFDLAIEDNILWQLIHGGPLFASTPIYGTQAITHFCRHANFIAFALAPIYAIFPRAETLLILQSVWLGAGAVVLFFLARLRVNGVLAMLLSLIYLLYAPLHGAHLYDFHFLTLAPLPIFALLYAVERRATIWTAVFLVIALSVREDVSLGVIAVGLYYTLFGNRPRVGISLVATGILYFVWMKGFVMPSEHGQPTFLFLYRGMMPPGAENYSGVMQTLILNPSHLFTVLLRQDKLIFLLQLLLPVALLPFRAPSTLILLLPAAVFSLAVQISPTATEAPFRISFQYTSHWTPYVFFATVIALQRIGNARSKNDRSPSVNRRAAAVALLFAGVAVSHQFGAVLQQHTALSGFDKFVFTTSSEDLARRAERNALIAQIPADAKVAASERELPHLSNRRFAYALRQGIFDAEYVLFSFGLPWTTRYDLAAVRRILQDRSFGVVDVGNSFVLLRRGASSNQNAQLLRRIGG